MKAQRSIRSTTLNTRNWNLLKTTDLAIFVADSVKRMDFQLKAAIKRLKGTKIEPQNIKIDKAILDQSFTLEKYMEGKYEISEAELKYT